MSPNFTGNVLALLIVLGAVALASLARSAR